MYRSLVERAQKVESMWRQATTGLTPRAAYWHALNAIKPDMRPLYKRGHEVYSSHHRRLNESYLDEHDRLKLELARNQEDSYVIARLAKKAMRNMVWRDEIELRAQVMMRRFDLLSLDEADMMAAKNFEMAANTYVRSARALWVSLVSPLFYTIKVIWSEQDPGLMNYAPRSKQVVLRVDSTVLGKLPDGIAYTSYSKNYQMLLVHVTDAGDGMFFAKWVCKPGMRYKMSTISGALYNGEAIEGYLNVEEVIAHRAEIIERAHERARVRAVTNAINGSAA